jgi:predicted enzyme related to lactoylglutathione lyase
LSSGESFVDEVGARRRPELSIPAMPFVDEVTPADRAATGSLRRIDVANKIVHAEVVGKDGPALHRFYGELFDWTQNTDLPGGYAMTDAAESNIVLGTGPAPDGSAGWVTFYVSVSDLDGTLARAETLGGRVVMPRFSPAPDTFLAMVADPEGHVIGLSQGA